MWNIKQKKKETDLVLIMCPGWGVVHPPIGISYLKGFLQANGVTVKCLDLSLALYKVFREKKYWDLNYPEHFIMPDIFKRDIAPFVENIIPEWVQKILSYEPKAVGLSLFMSSLNVSLLLADNLKKVRPALPILGGGAEVTRFKRVFVEGIRMYTPLSEDIFFMFDVLIEGEGEETLLDVVSRLKEGRDFRNIDGILYKDNKDIIANQPRRLNEDLDIFGPPDYEDFPIYDYTRKALPIVTSRGCVNRCTFCADSPLWKTYRSSSAKKAVDEIEFLSQRYNRREFEITDSTFNGDVRRVEEICELLLSRNIDVRWSAKATLRKEMTYDLLLKMKKAGCFSLSYGVESGSADVLRDMGKSPDLELAKRVIRDTDKAGIQANCFFIIGYPTETEEDFSKTLDFIKENAPFIYSFNQVTGCHIEDDSCLGLNLEKYGIVFREDGWYSDHSSPQIRKERLGRFKLLARELHKHYKCEVQQ